MPADGVLVVDGVFALRTDLVDHWELAIWGDITPELSVQRGTGRDADRDGRATAETLHRDRYGGAEDIYIGEADPADRADVVIDNTDIATPLLTPI